MEGEVGGEVKDSEAKKGEMEMWVAGRSLGEKEKVG